MYHTAPTLVQSNNKTKADAHYILYYTASSPYELSAAARNALAFTALHVVIEFTYIKSNLLTVINWLLWKVIGNKME